MKENQYEDWVFKMAMISVIRSEVGEELSEEDREAKIYDLYK